MSRDPLEILASLNPVARLAESLSSDDAMLATIIASVPPTTVLSRRRRRGVWAALGTTVVVLGVAAFAILRQESPANPTRIVCFTDASVPPSGMHALDVSNDPVEACGVLWSNGVIASGEPPALTACVTNEGTIAVIPGDQQVCAQLGFANWVGAFSDDERRIVEFQTAVTEWFGTQCVPQGDALPQAEQFVADFDLDGWTVTDSGHWGVDRPCAASGVDPVTKTVNVGGRRRSAADNTPTT